jgi:heat shock protein HtpX
MAMNFWESQRQAKSKTFWFNSLFVFLTLLTATLAELIMRAYAPEQYDPPFPVLGFIFLAVIFLTAAFNYNNYLQYGGSYVAESLNAELIDPRTDDPKERQLLNIVEEIALSASLPTPPVYVLDAEEINAFAAGTSPENAAITVTRGTLYKLNRDELQGVIAHEFGHVYNSDMKVTMRISAMIMGFFVVTYLGLRLMQGASFRRDSDEKKGVDPIMLAAIILIVAGLFTWFFGSILRAAVSRQREFLADACSVQFTRNPNGILGALKKIKASTDTDMPKDGAPYSHLYFNERPSLWQRLFATHPPLDERIAVIEAEKKNTP